MNSVTQDMKFRQSLLKYSQKYGVTKAAIKYKTNRQYIYRWLRRYDGTIDSLREKSRRPHHHPNQHTEQELKLIKDMRRRNPSAGLVVFWVKLRQRGYTRTVTGLYRVLRRSGEMAIKPKNPKYIPKPYEQMNYPGERVQIDVKFVPAACLVGAAAGKKFYQYTAIDEFSRYRYLEAFEENSTYSSTQFLIHMLDHFQKLGFSVKCVQTDNGFEFTKRFGGSHRVITARWNAHTARIMSTFTQLILFTPSTTSKLSLPSIFVNTITFPCARLTGSLLRLLSIFFCALV